MGAFDGEGPEPVSMFSSYHSYWPRHIFHISIVAHRKREIILFQSFLMANRSFWKVSHLYLRLMQACNNEWYVSVKAEFKHSLLFDRNSLPDTK